MKKIILGMSGILLIAFVIVMVANAQHSPQEVKKAATETKMDCGKCPSAAACATATDTKKAETKVCDPANCKKMGCDPAKCKEGKCDMAKCKENCTGSTGEMKKCDPSKCGGMVNK
jgi:hypothetical protein